MPTDTRRLSGPENCQSPYGFAATTKLDLDSLEKRLDGRSTAQLRPMFLRTGVISQARGSGYIEMHQTKVICSVYGPREVIRREDFSLKGQLTCDFKFCTFACKRRRQFQQDNQEKDLSVQILEALEPAVCLHKYPKSQINIFVTVLQHDGSALAASIMCACLALASARVEMYDVVVASSAAVCGPLTIVDPTAVEEETVLKHKTSDKDAGTVTLAYLPSLNQVSAISSDGEISFNTVDKTMQQCVSNCQKLYPILEQTLVKHLQEKHDERDVDMDKT